MTERAQRRFLWTVSITGALVIVALSALAWWLADQSEGRMLAKPTVPPESTLGFVLPHSPAPLPDITFRNREGHRFRIADFRGQVVLLNIWATWCAPCREEMPALDRLQATLGGSEFVVLPVSIDRDGVPAVSEFYSEHGIQHLGLYVADEDPAAALAIVGIPTTILIDRQGREIGRKLGPARWDSDAAIVEFQRHVNRHPNAE